MKCFCGVQLRSAKRIPYSPILQRKETYRPGFTHGPLCESNMKLRIVALLLALFLHSFAPFVFAQVSLRLPLERRPSALELSWSASFAGPDGRTVRPFFELQRSRDLRQWQPFGERLRAPLAAPDQTLSVSSPVEESFGFFRLLQFEPRPIVAR